MQMHSYGLQHAYDPTLQDTLQPPLPEIEQEAALGPPD